MTKKLFWHTYVPSTHKIFKKEGKMRRKRKNIFEKFYPRYPGRYS